MATFSLLLLLIAAAVSVLISPALSQNCSSHTFSTPNTTFEHCMNLSALNAQLHWTYVPAPANTLSVAFIVINNLPQYWIAWGLNPNATGMLGAQAFIASRSGSTSSLSVNTYNISTTNYAVGGPSNISYPVLNMSVEHVNSNTTIFATLQLPDATPVLNHVWQVGMNTSLAMHGTTTANLESKGILTLAGAPPGSPAGSPSGSPAGSPAESPPALAGPTGGGGNGTSSSGGARLGSYAGVVFVLLWASLCFGF